MWKQVKPFGYYNVSGVVPWMCQESQVCPNAHAVTFNRLKNTVIDRVFSQVFSQTKQSKCWKCFLGPALTLSPSHKRYSDRTVAASWTGITEKWTRSVAADLGRNFFSFGYITGGRHAVTLSFLSQPGSMCFAVTLLWPSSNCAILENLSVT